jgi:hypothetical protein
MKKAKLAEDVSLTQKVGHVFIATADGGGIPHDIPMPAGRLIAAAKWSIKKKTVLVWILME